MKAAAAWTDLKMHQPTRFAVWFSFVWSFLANLSGARTAVGWRPNWQDVPSLFWPEWLTYFYYYYYWHIILAALALALTLTLRNKCAYILILIYQQCFLRAIIYTRYTLPPCICLSRQPYTLVPGKHLHPCIKICQEVAIRMVSYQGNIVRNFSVLRTCWTPSCVLYTRSFRPTTRLFSVFFFQMPRRVRGWFVGLSVKKRTLINVKTVKLEPTNIWSA